MHNGGIPHFDKVKRKLCNLLSLFFYERLSGTTDSEHIFALFLTQLEDSESQLSACEIAKSINITMCIILKLCEDCGVVEGCSFNFLITDGVNVIATRFRSNSEQPPSLYYNFGTNYSSNYGNFLTPSGDPTTPGGVIVTSNPINKCGFDLEGVDDGPTNQCQWFLIPANHMLICVGDEMDLGVVRNYRIVPIESKAKIGKITCHPLKTTAEDTSLVAALDVTVITEAAAKVEVLANDNEATTAPIDNTPLIATPLIATPLIGALDESQEAGEMMRHMRELV
jgi:hypothetical protein